MVNEHRPEACVQTSGAQHHDEKLFYVHKERSTNIALELVYKYFVPNDHDEKQFYEHKERSTTIALELVYKHLVPKHHDEKQFYEHKEQ